MRKTMILWVVILMVVIPVTAQNLENIDEIAPYSEGLAAVRKGSQWGFIDKTGTIVIEPQCLNIFPFQNGYTTGVLFDKNFKG